MARAQALHRAVDNTAYRLALAVQGEAEDGRVRLTPRLTAYLEAFAAADRAATEDRDARWAAIGIVPGAGAAAGA